MIRLPSGRKLAYLKPDIVYREFIYETLEEDADGNEIIVEAVNSKDFATPRA